MPCLKKPFPILRIKSKGITHGRPHTRVSVVSSCAFQIVGYYMGHDKMPFMNAWNSGELNGVVQNDSLSISST